MLPARAKTKIGDQNTIFIGGRGNNKTFFEDMVKRTGVKINLVTTSSEKKAQAALMETLALEQASELVAVLIVWNAWKSK